MVMQKCGDRIYSNRKMGMTDYITRVDNGVKIVQFATSKNLVFKRKMFRHRNIHKYTWNSPDGKTHSQIYHTLTDRR
jgi:hypothetical protein